MTKNIQLCGIGNAIVDIFLDVSEDEFSGLGFQRGSMELVEHDAQQVLLQQFQESPHDLRLVSGGSVANSVIGFSQLGGKAAFIGCVGDDRYGLHYAEEFEQLHIDIGNPVLVGKTTGTCLAFITPDAERTMRTCLAVSSELSSKHVDASRIVNSEWLFIEGYVFANPATGQTAIREAVRIAKENGTKIALTASDAFVPQVFGDVFREITEQADLLFCNGPESLAITGASDTQAAFQSLKKMLPNFVITDGPHGAHVRFAETECHVPANACDPKDLTGAGDMFAGAFLYGITHGYRPEVAARAANFLCMKVITQVGARLHSGVEDYWREVTAA